MNTLNANDIIKATNHSNSISLLRPTWLEIELDSVRSNVLKLKQLIGDKVHLMAVIKADAYGYGAIEIAEISISSGATWLGVATLDEAVFVRKKLPQFVPILVLGYISTEHLSIAARFRITVTAVSLNWIQEADKVAEQPFDFHLKLDTGLNRIGCKTLDEIRAVIGIVSHNPHMNWTGVFTHLSTGDNVIDKSYYYEQLTLFQNFLDIIPDRESKIIHCANSAVTLLHTDKLFFDMVRLGRALTGPPNSKLKHLQPFPLQTTEISLHSSLIHVKQLNAGQKISYDGIYVTSGKEWIGTVPIGRADGWHYRLNASTALVGGKRVPIVGKFSMDQLIVVLPEEYPVGTKVTFIGRQGNEMISIDEIVTSSNHFKYDIFVTFSHRIPRLYFLNGSLYRVKNRLLESIDIT